MPTAPPTATPDPNVVREELAEATSNSIDALAATYYCVSNSIPMENWLVDPTDADKADSVRGPLIAKFWTFMAAHLRIKRQEEGWLSSMLGNAVYLAPPPSDRDGGGGGDGPKPQPQSLEQLVAALFTAAGANPMALLAIVQQPKYAAGYAALKAIVCGGPPPSPPLTPPVVPTMLGGVPPAP